MGKQTDFSVDIELLARFEAGIDPRDIESSSIPASLLGYGEISAVFKIQGLPLAFKRLPVFSDRAQAEDYAEKYLEYCGLLREAGLDLPESEPVIVQAPGRPPTLYIAQQLQPSERFGHRLLETLTQEEAGRLFNEIAANIAKVWEFNDSRPEFELAVDGQLSNWVRPVAGGGLKFVDTSTPLFRKSGVEQLDPGLLLKAAPWFLRWLFNLFFVDDVINRYYDPRQVLIDLAANLFKEQRPDLIPLALEAAKKVLPPELEGITKEDIEKYYRQDKFIWTLFLSVRRLDRWLSAKVFRRRYEFILPGPINR